ncbi:ABC transporter permease [Catellatospora paridis]|uniref:ABC transporter permease n=1 Tax=Catellatospora paridis TaxID=1617086 RepID=UPI001E511311|nr:ABC transporter permease [Catellatospora paridis]
MSLLTEGGPEPAGNPGPTTAADPPVAGRPGASAAAPPTSADRSTAADPDPTAGDSAADMDLTGGTATADGAAVAVDAGPGAGAAAFAPLPRRQPPRRVPRVFAVRAPIPRPSRLVLTVLSVLVPLALWQLLSAAIDGRPDYLPSPAQAWAAGLDMARDGLLLGDTLASIRRVLLGFGLAVAVSVPLGIAMGAFQAGRAAFEPVIGLLRYLPASAFIPLLALWLGIDEMSKVALLFLGTVFFNTLMTADAVRRVPGALVDVSYTLGARRGEVLRKVVIPFSLPGILDAIRVNAAAAWNFVVVAELFAAEEGLGYRIVRSQRFNQIDRIFAVLVVIALIGLTIDVALRLLRDRVGRWTS